MKTTTEIRFGWLPELWSYATASVAVEPLPEADEHIRRVQEDPQSDNWWFYPRLEHPLKRPPHRPRKAFCLPSTHMMRTDIGDDPKQFLELAIQALGMSKGLRLVPEGWSHFYAAAIVINPFTDLNCHKRDVEKILEGIERFWRLSRPETRRLMFGAIHWHLFAHSYSHEFERFNAQYTVLDTCWRIHESLGRAPSRRVPHGALAETLCGYYRIPVPKWAQRASGKQRSKLADLRNELVHAALYAGQPIGFKPTTSHEPCIDQQLACLNIRLIVAVLGIQAPNLIQRRVDDDRRPASGL